MTTFPIMGCDERHDCGQIPTSIPWKMIAPHEARAQKNHSQSLSRLAERGGLSYSEALAVLQDRPWQKMDHIGAMIMLKDMVEAYKKI